jgi:hypothetical protein
MAFDYFEEWSRSISNRIRKSIQEMVMALSEGLERERAQVATKGHKKKVFHKKSRQKVKPSSALQNLLNKNNSL